MHFINGSKRLGIPLFHVVPDYYSGLVIELSIDNPDGQDRTCRLQMSVFEARNLVNQLKQQLSLIAQDISE